MTPAFLLDALRTRYGLFCESECLEAMLSDKFGNDWYKELPVDLDYFAEDAGFEIREVDELPASGLVAEFGGRSQILVLSSDSSRRKRFTVSHEIMHILFKSFPRRTADGDDSWPDEEDLCDLGASLLLVPSNYFDAECEPRQASMTLIEQIRQTCDVSYEAAATTLALRHPDKFLIAKWKLDEAENLILEKAIRSKGFSSHVWIKQGEVIPGNRQLARWASEHHGARAPNSHMIRGLNGKAYFYAQHRRLGSISRRYVLSMFTPQITFSS